MNPAPRPRVLLIDAPEQTQMYALGLEADGYEVLSESDCDRAIALARRFPPAVIVLDVRLRDGAGWESCLRLSRDPATRGIPIVVLTTSVFEADETAAQEVGASRLLHKPCSPATLIEVIESLAPPQAGARADT